MRVISTILTRNSIFLFVVLLFLSCKKDRIEAQSSNSKVAKIPITPAGGVNPNLSNVYFYIENSASIHGYLSGTSDYRRVLSALATKEDFDKVNYHFMLVNGKEPDLRINNIGNTAVQLSQKLNLGSFNVGNPRASDLNAMFNLAMEKVTSNSISILVSDGIYDIGSGGEQALITAGDITKQKFIGALNKNSQLQCLLIKLNSPFQGRYYYASISGSVTINHNRPYYIWIFGNSKVLNHYFTDSYLTGLVGFENYHRFYTIKSVSSLNYEVHSSFNKQGRFRIDNKDKSKITDAEKAKTNRFSFAIAVDFKNIPLADSFLQNLNNYTINNNYSIKSIARITDTQKAQIYLKSATHLITVETSGFVIGELKIKLKYGLPKWITDSSADNENNLNQSKTYGFKHLIKGMNDAFTYINQNQSFPEIKINITK